MRTRFPAAVATAIAFTGLPALAQMSADVQFQAGNYGTMLTGEITGNDYFDYKLGANAGQSMFVELTADGGDGDGTIYFNVLPPGSSDEAIYNGNGRELHDGRAARLGRLHDPRLSHGQRPDTGKTVGYNVDVSIQ